MLENGNNALDWSGLGLAAALFGITDIEGLIRRLMVIKHFNRRSPSEEP